MSCAALPCTVGCPLQQRGEEPTTAPPNMVGVDTALWIRLARLSERLKMPLVPALAAIGSAEGFVEASPEEQEAALGGLSPHHRRVLSATLGSDCADDVALLERIGASVVAVGSPEYPRGLLDLPDAPPCYFCLGDPTCLLRRTVAIVGSRHTGRYGLDMARRLAGDLAAAGVCVVSGLAVGVDAAAHEGALDAGGLTAAVLGCGIANPYPRRTAPLRRRIADTGGAVISELPPSAEPAPANFPHRNRLVAALTLATVVVGASESSGALITAEWAVELGREVAAVPGSVRDPFNRGAHRLIKEGAHIADNAEAVLSLIGATPSDAAPAKLDLGSLSPAEQTVFALLSNTAVHRDALGEAAGLDAASLATVLTKLVTLGLAEGRPGGSYVRGI